MSLPSLNKVIIIIIIIIFIIIIIIKNPYYVLLKARGTLHMKGGGDARRKFWIKLLKGVAQAFADP